MATRKRLGRIRLAGILAVLVAIVAAPGAHASERIPVLILFEDGRRAGDVAAVERAGGRVDHAYEIVPAIAARIPEDQRERLDRSPRLEVEPDLPVLGLDYRSTHDWGVAHVRADLLHAAGHLGSGVRSGVIDSGIDCAHVELSGRCLHGKDFVDESLTPDDDWGHGTHVAGSAAAQRDPDLSTGVVGVSPSATVLGHKILDDQGVG